MAKSKTEHEAVGIARIRNDCIHIIFLSPVYLVILAAISLVSHPIDMPLL